MMDALRKQIDHWKNERNAVILAHNYQNPEVQDLADYTGDSLGLSRQAAATDADVIVFCGVYFMAETAAILSPEKTVLIPDPQAGCPMVTMSPLEEVRAFKAAHPEAAVVTYVNSSAEVKAVSDICCTSANAIEVVASIPAETPICFVPDRYLGSYVAQQTGRDLILFPGYCPTHVRIIPEHIHQARRDHPGAPVIVHPECRSDVTALADAALSTSGMCRYAHESDADEIIAATEIGMLHRLRKENPDKLFHTVAQGPLCPNMKKITVPKVLWALEEMRHVVSVPEETRRKALEAVERMIVLG